MGSGSSPYFGDFRSLNRLLVFDGPVLSPFGSAFVDLSRSRNTGNISAAHHCWVGYPPTPGRHFAGFGDGSLAVAQSILKQFEHEVIFDTEDRTGPGRESPSSFLVSSAGDGFWFGGDYPS